MRLATYLSEQGAPRVAAVRGDGESLVDLVSASELIDGTAPRDLRSMQALLDAGAQAMDAARRLLEHAPPEAAMPLDRTRLLAPLPQPRSIRDCMAFERHLINATRTVVRWKFPPLAWADRWKDRLTGRPLIPTPAVWRERPIYYKGNPYSVVGHGAEVHWPSWTNKLDFELEFGVFIGAEGRDIAATYAWRHIAGYTIFNDFSARDVQMREMQGRLGPAKSKDFDTGNSLGPFLVTPDEVGDVRSLAMKARVNGETWTDSSSREMYFSFEEIIEYISRDETLRPGEFIGSGTAPGGCGLELDRWIKPGDVVELEVERLGVLSNRIGPTAPGL